MADALSENSRSLEKAEAKIDSLGLPRPEKPRDRGDDNPEWPDNVADLSPDQLAEHMTWWSGWSAYARYHLGRAETNLAAFARQLKHETSMRLYKSRGDYATVTEAKASIEQMPDMAKLAKREQEAEALVTTLKSLLKGYEDKYSTSSREISRRGLDFDHSVGEEGDRFYAR